MDHGVLFCFLIPDNDGRMSLLLLLLEIYQLFYLLGCCPTFGAADSIS